MSKATDRACDPRRYAGPGSQLTETDIAELCGVSRTPVREAMGRLDAEMFIERTDRQRSFVSNRSDDDIEDLFTLRTMLESYAAGRAAPGEMNEPPNSTAGITSLRYLRSSACSRRR